MYVIVQPPDVVKTSFFIIYFSVGQVLPDL